MYPELVELAGGVDNVLGLAQKQLKAGELIKAIHLVEVALEAEQENKKVTETHIQVLQAFVKAGG